MDQKFYERHKERICAHVKAKYQENPEPTKQRVSKWKKDNPDLKSIQNKRYKAKRNGKRVNEGTIQGN